MTDILSDFFDVAQKKAGEILADRESEAEYARRRRDARNEAERKLKAAVEAEFSDIIDVLRALPARADGRKFHARLSGSSSDEAAAYKIELVYDTQSMVLQHLTPAPAAGIHDTPVKTVQYLLSAKPYLGVDLQFTQKNGALDILITRKDTNPAENKKHPGHNSERVGSFSEARKALGLAVAEMVPERISELGVAISVQKKLQAQAKPLRP